MTDPWTTGLRLAGGVGDPKVVRHIRRIVADAPPMTAAAMAAVVTLLRNNQKENTP